MTEAPAPNAASVAILDGPRVLLIQRAFEPLRGLWTLPGGRHETGELIEATAIREIREEVGLRISGLRPVLVMEVARAFRLQVFATRHFSGDIVASPEILAYRWLPPAELGDLPVTPRLAEVLERALVLFPLD